MHIGLASCRDHSTSVASLEIGIPGRDHTMNGIGNVITGRRAAKPQKFLPLYTISLRFPQAGTMKDSQL